VAAGALVLLLLLLVAGVGATRAEVIEVRQVARGMECPECAHNLQVQVKRLDGIETASASWNRRVLTVRFARGSRSTLGDVRAVVRRQNFVPGEAEIVVIGRLRRETGGVLVLEGGPGARYRLDVDPHRPLALAAGDVIVTGRVPGEDAGATDRAEPAALSVLDVKDEAPPPRGCAGERRSDSGAPEGRPREQARP
jgi:hypothetical protein